MLNSRPPKGGTLTAAGVASPKVRDNPSLSVFRVYAEHRQISEQISRETAGAPRQRRNEVIFTPGYLPEST
ncbi:MAG: hypothetical protein ACP5MD_03220 [Verrucomicrobiia bacterium]